jgi:hypothetical protein
LFCGIPDALDPVEEGDEVVEGDEVDVELELLAGADEPALDELLEDPPPQPATASATAIRTRLPKRLIVLKLSPPIGSILPFVIGVYLRRLWNRSIPSRTAATRQ